MAKERNFIKTKIKWTEATRKMVKIMHLKVYSFSVEQLILAISVAAVGKRSQTESIRVVMNRPTNNTNHTVGKDITIQNFLSETSHQLSGDAFGGTQVNDLSACTAFSRLTTIQYSTTYSLRRVLRYPLHKMLVARVTVPLKRAVVAVKLATEHAGSPEIEVIESIGNISLGLLPASDVILCLRVSSPSTHGKMEAESA